MVTCTPGAIIPMVSVDILVRKTFLTEPEKVMENVRMVWCDEIEQNAIWTDLANVNPNDYGTTCYDDTFI